MTKQEQQELIEKLKDDVFELTRTNIYKSN